MRVGAKALDAWPAMAFASVLLATLATSALAMSMFAPPHSHGSIASEGAIVTAQGVGYLKKKFIDDTLAAHGKKADIF